MFLVLSLVVYSLSVNADVLFPRYSTLPIQWIQTNIWHDCLTMQVLEPTNCNEDDSQILECLVIPTSGLCTGQITTDITDLYLFIYGTFQSQCEISVQINNETPSIYSLDLNKKNILIPIHSSGDQLNFKIIQVSGDQFYLLKAQLQTDDNIEGCQEKAEDLQCKTCASQYFRYYGRCFLKDCLTQIQDTASSLVTTQLDLVDDSIRQTFNMNLGDCILPIVYMIKSIEEPILTQNFPQRYLKRDDTQKLTLTIPLSELSLLPCDQLETASAFVTQCYISLIATLNGMIQMQFITLLRLKINKEVQAQVTYDNQDFQIPDSCCEQISINALSEATIIDTKSIEGRQYLIVQQTLYDPSYSTYEIQFESATLIDGLNRYPLILTETKYDDVAKQITYTLEISPIEYNPQTAVVEVNSQLTAPKQRLLVESILDKIQPLYFMNSTINMNITNLKYEKPTNKIQETKRDQDHSVVITSKEGNGTSKEGNESQPLLVLLFLLFLVILIGGVLYMILDQRGSQNQPQIQDVFDEKNRQTIELQTGIGNAFQHQSPYSDIQFSKPKNVLK